MIEYMNTKLGGSVHFKYSTPEEYFKSLNNLNLTWSVNTADFFPYFDFNGSYWTGFYTSRPNDKGFVRRVSSNFHSSCLLYARQMLD